MFQKGQSGNPGGRGSNGRPISESLRMLLRAEEDDVTSGAYRKPRGSRTVAEAIAMTLIRKSIAGDPAAIKEVLDRTEGKAVQAIESNVNLSIEAIYGDSISRLKTIDNDDLTQVYHLLGGNISEAIVVEDGEEDA